MWVEFDNPQETIEDARAIASILKLRHDESYTIQIVALHVDVCEEMTGEPLPIRSR